MTEPMTYEAWVQWYLALGAPQDLAEEKAQRMVSGFPHTVTLPDGTPVDT